ncbi:energy transducer TonB [Psychroserpens sp. Hel_I_66]|uniref:energy transducer TonB n=1 Tax=Psychroserpens sp. Hel_I_66 TaxID=1250004 RepID=UPI000A458E77|nr:energy transducer TonB [Psychroserpens sp. Hel_I_66]
METYTQYIELINDYLNNLLSKEVRLNFESKLQNDSEFNTIYQQHIVFVNGIERIEIKTDIQKAKRAYKVEKWLKIAGISIVILGAMVMLYTLVFNTSENELAPKSDNSKTTVIDSTFIENNEIDSSLDVSEDITDTIEKQSSYQVSYKTTSNSSKLGIASTTNLEIKKRPQTISFNTQNDTTIICKEGTVLKISKGSFVNSKTGKTINGTIELKVTEYYKLSDILLANLSTVSNGKQLETGGMLFIEAKQGGTDLNLKDDKPIEISFPTKNKKKGMQLFNGEWEDENINWTLQNDEILEDLDISEEEIEDHIDVPFNVVEQVPTFPGCENEGTNEARKKCTSDAISKFITTRFNTKVAIGLGLSGRQRINSIFKIDKDGNVIFIQSRGSHPRLSEQADRVIGLLPKMIPGMQRGKPVNVPYSLPIVFEIDGEQNSSQFDTENGSANFITTRIQDSIGINRQVVSGIEMDTLYSTSRGIVQTIREVMHDKDFPVDSTFADKWRQYKKEKLIRLFGVLGLESEPTVMLRKPLFEMKNTKFKILEDDSITRGGHIIRKLWGTTQIPSTRIFELVPKKRFAVGTEVITTKEFETRLSDVDDVSISSKDVGYYVLRTSNLGWINCDRFINGRKKQITYKLKIKDADGASISMVFKAYNSVLPSWKTNGFYDFRTIADNEDIVLVAIKRKNGKLYYDMVETKTEINPNINLNFKEVSIDQLKTELEQLNSNFDKL